ncbi:MAG TPA: recombinase family protein, partial [Actinomycetes bacterium]
MGVTRTAAIYARSSVENADSIASQILACKQEATGRGWSVRPENIYEDDDVSASTSRRRPQYESMLGAIRRG